MRQRYLLYMASLSLLHIFAFSSFIATGGDYSLLPVALVANLVLIVGVNLVGAILIFAPIHRYLRDQSNSREAHRRIHSLPVISAAWGTGLVGFLMGFAFFGLSAPCPGCDIRVMGPFYAAMIVLFCTFTGIFLYFLIDDYQTQLKAHIYDQFGTLIIPGGGRLLHKFIAAFVVVGVVPVSLAFSEILLFSEARELMGVSVSQGLSFALAISVFMAGSSFYFIQRNLNRPLQSLERAMGSLAEGNLDATTPVLTDDEIGRLAAGFNRMVIGLQEREFIRETFGKYVPETVAQSILENRGEIVPQHRLATILYTDIQGFTGICESLDPDQVVSLLNRYFSLLVDVIDRHGGVVNQFQGDALLVTFNVPIENPSHAGAAISAAIEIQDALEEYEFVDDIEMVTRIGINTGNVVAGSVGANERLNYTVHGDAVNMAARLENLNKQFGTRILVSATTREAAGDAFEFKPIGTINIRGKAEAIDVFTVD